MTHHALDATTIADVLEHLIENGLDGMAYAIEIVLNESMKPICSTMSSPRSRCVSG